MELLLSSFLLSMNLYDILISISIAPSVGFYTHSTSLMPESSGCHILIKTHRGIYIYAHTYGCMMTALTSQVFVLLQSHTDFENRFLKRVVAHTLAWMNAVR